MNRHWRSLILVLGLNGNLLAHAQEKSFQMDIPTDWMRLAQSVREIPKPLSEDEADLKWGTAPELGTSLRTFHGPIRPAAQWGSLAATYTSVNLNGSAQYGILRLRSELSYTPLSHQLTAISVHDFRTKAGIFWQPPILQWQSGTTGVSLMGLWAHWFAPESRQSLAQHDGRGGVLSTVELRQNLGSPRIKAVVSVGLESLFIATPTQQNSWQLQTGLGATL